jgi:hypothetical protein
MSSPYADKVKHYGQHWQTPWLFFGVFLLVAMCLFFLPGPPGHRHSHGPVKIAEGDSFTVKIAEGDSFTVIAAIGRAPRAIVFLDANWSVYTEEGRSYFKEAAAQLARSDFPSIEFFILDEWPLEKDKQDQGQHTQAWLASLNLKELSVGRGFGIGSGSILWLEANKVVAEEWSARSATTSGIVKRTQALWGR